MRTSCVKNGLVVAIVLLFVGVAVQPAIAVNPISSDNEEDCDICPKVSKQHLVRLKRLINRVETLNNKLSVVSKHNPEVEEEYQKLSDRIINIKEMNKGLKPDIQLNDEPLPLVCYIITLILLPFFIADEILSPIFDRIEEQSLLWYLIVPFVFTAGMAIVVWNLLMFEFNCIDINLP